MPHCTVYWLLPQQITTRVELIKPGTKSEKHEIKNKLSNPQTLITVIA